MSCIKSFIVKSSDVYSDSGTFLNPDFINRVVDICSRFTFENNVPFDPVTKSYDWISFINNSLYDCGDNFFVFTVFTDRKFI